MSLIILANKSADIDQTSRFIDQLDVYIDAYNNSITNEPEKSTLQPIDRATFSKRANELLQGNTIRGLIQHIITLENLLIQEPKQSVSLIIILVHIINKIKDNKERLETINDLNEYILTRDESLYNLKFKLLAAVFNTVNEGELKYATFKKILDLADKVNKPNVLLVHLTMIDQYVASWNLNKDQEIDLYRSALSLINKSDDKYYREKHQVYTKYLTALNAKFDQQVFNQNKKDIENVILRILITFPDNIDFNNLLELKSISEVKNSNTVLYELFSLALNGDYQEFIQWNQKNSNFLKSNGISEQKIIDRVRLRSFFKLAQNKKSLKINEVQKSLDLNETEAEFWIIKALQSGRVDGKIDQLEGFLYINGINDTSFKSGDWKELDTKLESFKKQFEGMIEHLKKDK